MTRDIKVSKANGDEVEVKKTSARRGSKGKRSKGRNNRRDDKRVAVTHHADAEKLDQSRSNNPAWYYTDEKMADQVSQLSFQNFAGWPINYDGKDFDVPNVVRISLSPAPGVQLSQNYNTGLAQRSGINMAAFKLYSRLSAFTGRTQSYAPQDVAMMILAFGEVISITECIRRMFGVAYTMNMRNRDYPKQVLEFGMLVDADDLFQNYANYLTDFNAIITLINQLTIPKNIAYFDKCAALYEKLFLDSSSSMAQTLVTMPYTSWQLDETSYSGGSILKTIPFACGAGFNPTNTVQTMAYYLNILKGMVTTLLNSSSLHIIYCDIMNLATKQSVEYWRMDFLYNGYSVFPEYDTTFLLQMHNATVCGFPGAQATFVSSPDVVTPYNDVYPDPNNNAVYYNPAFFNISRTATGAPRTGSDALIDMMSDAVTVNDRVEVTRYTAIGEGKRYQPTGQTVANAWIDTALPDHYVNIVDFENMTNNLTSYRVAGTLVSDVEFPDISSLVSNIDWAPRFFEVANGTSNYTGRYTSDVNFYTVVDARYIRKLHDFVGLALYDIRG